MFVLLCLEILAELSFESVIVL